MRLIILFIFLLALLAMAASADADGTDYCNDGCAAYPEITDCFNKCMDCWDIPDSEGMGECLCFLWYSWDCWVTVDPPCYFPCFYGECGNSTCSCDDGWTGDACTEPTCSVKGDLYPCDSTVSDSELVGYIQLWALAYIDDLSLLDAIDNWSV